MIIKKIAKTWGFSLFLGDDNDITNRIKQYHILCMFFPKKTFGTPTINDVELETVIAVLVSVFALKITNAQLEL